MIKIRSRNLNNVSRLLRTIAFAIAAFDLRRRVSNSKSIAQRIAHVVQKQIVPRLLFHHQMNSQRHFGCAHRPNVEIVNGCHAPEIR